MFELYLHSSICLHGVVLNYLSVGTTLFAFNIDVKRNVYLPSGLMTVTNKPLELAL
jgi:hypothetical protein